MHPPRRVLAASAALAASLCLVGCSVDATIEVTADDMVSVDVTAVFVYGRDMPTADEAASIGDDPCQLLIADTTGLVVTRTEEPSEDAVVCHVSGRGPLASISAVDGALVHTGDRYTAHLTESAASQFVGGYLMAGMAARPSVIRLRLPARIESTDALGTAEGNVVTWTASSSVTPEAGGFYASTASTEVWGMASVALAGGGGLVVGALLALGALRTWRRDAAGATTADDGPADEGPP